MSQVYSELFWSVGLEVMAPLSGFRGKWKYLELPYPACENGLITVVSFRA